MVAYREIANGAQVKVHAIQLVLAALLANGDAAGRVLVLDELGNSLGDVNKRDVLTSLKQVAAEQQVTILGTCQDAVLVAAAEVCGEVLWFTHASDADAYNQPTRVWAFDPDGERVELTADWVRSGRNHV
jgi:ABC-type hemin transport system ATPase subunit